MNESEDIMLAYSLQRGYCDLGLAHELIWSSGQNKSLELRSIVMVYGLNSNTETL